MAITNALIRRGQRDITHTHKRNVKTEVKTRAMLLPVRNVNNH